MGHDYTNQEKAQRMGIRVIEAVNDFVRESGWHFFALTQEGFPAYLLFRSAASEAAAQLAGRLLHELEGTVEIRDPLQNVFVHKRLSFSDDSERLLPSF